MTRTTETLFAATLAAAALVSAGGVASAGTSGIGGLEQGDLPGTPYVVKEVLRDGSTTIAGAKSPGFFEPVKDGWVVNGEYNGSTRLLRVDKETPAKAQPISDDTQSVHVNADGTRIAWFEEVDDSGKGRLTVADGASGRTLASHPVDGRVDVSGLVGEQVVYDDGSEVDLWDPRTDEISHGIATGASSTATDGDSIYATTADNGCTSTYDLRSDQSRWTNCDAGRVLSFSAGGSYALTQADDDQLQIVDNETGEIVIDKITYPGHQARWESDGALLLNHRADGEGNAVVRLDVADDSYELATEVLPDPNHEDGTPPYSLGNTTIWPF